MRFEEATPEQQELDRLTVQAIIEHMKQNMPTITYGELAKAIEEKRNKPMAPQGTAHSLGRIQEYCEEHGLPILSAMVVSKDQKEPSDGFFVAFEDVRGAAGKTEEEIIHKEQGACINCSDWSSLYEYMGIKAPESVKAD